VVGCGKGDDGIAQKAGEAIGQQVTDFTKGVGRGIDQQMVVQVALSPEVQALGLTNTIAKSLGMAAPKKGISIYLIASQSVSNALVARAINSSGAEIGRARTPVNLGKDEAGYVNFEFEDQMDSATVTSYRIGL
jgi:hypothetical protein